MTILSTEGEKLSAKQKAQEILFRVVLHTKKHWNEYEPMFNQMKGKQPEQVQDQIDKISKRIAKILNYDL